jgi:hypothetical protein
MQLRLAGAALAVALSTAMPAHGSVWIATGVQRAALQVNSAGDADIAWTQQGAGHFLLVPPTGRVSHPALSGRDVSRPAAAAGLPFALTTRRTPDGTHRALQLLPVSTGQPPELHLASWRGAPTALTLANDGTTLSGSATFHGAPVTGFTTTPTGTRIRIYVYLWCLGCAPSPSSWTRLLGVRPQADGTFSVALRPEWQGATRFRATLAGPNAGHTRAPDAVAFAAGS